MVAKKGLGHGSLSHTGKSTYLLLSAASEALAADVGNIGFKCVVGKESKPGERRGNVSLGGGPTGLLKLMAETGHAVAAFEGTFLLLIIACELCAQIGNGRAGGRKHGLRPRR
ncbi:hypothetical protein X737_33175 [Mesorhizobium sp. L48C026A00]|nr:hypothetical protein X737_33175 [Mesorhizobium sp. L48C026A00]